MICSQLTTFKLLKKFCRIAGICGTNGEKYEKPNICMVNV
jgi:hypothetical protein